MRWVLGLTVGACLFACGEDEPGWVRRDANVTDTGAQDATRDAAPDAALDAQPDAVPDAPSDALPPSDATMEADVFMGECRLDADCSDMTVTYCGEGATGQLILEDRGACVDNECVLHKGVRQNCLDLLPAAGPYCAVDGWHNQGTAHCEEVAGFPNCVVSDPATPCLPDADSCSDGVLTESRSTCDDTLGCGAYSVTLSCPNPPSNCSGSALAPVLTTYQRRCQNGTQCDDALGTQTLCTATSSCQGGIHTRVLPVCNADTETCTTAPGPVTDCATLDQCSINTLVNGCTVSFSFGQCDADLGCTSTAQNFVSCPSGQCTCGTTPGCL